MPTEDHPGTEDATALARVEATVVGRVQGVGFRYFALRRGADLGLRGWVANEPDGSVRTRAEGTRADLERFLGRARRRAARGHRRPRHRRLEPTGREPGSIRDPQWQPLRGLRPDADSHGPRYSR